MAGEVIKDKQKENKLKVEEKTTKEPVEENKDIDKDLDEKIKKEALKLAKELLKKEKEEMNKKEKTLKEELDIIKADQIKKAEEQKAKDEQIAKLLEDLKNKDNKDDILAEIEANKIKEKEAEREKKVAEALKKAEEALAEKIKAEEALALEKKLKEQSDERAKFEKELSKEALDKPYIADKIKKILAIEDYETQKNDYRFIKEYFDTEEVKRDFELRQTAGNSAFKGVKGATGSSMDKLDSFIDNYMKETQRKKKY